VSSCGPRTPGPIAVELQDEVRSVRVKGHGVKLVKEYKLFSNRNSYHGTWLEGRMHGRGLYTWSDGSEYSGEFYEGYMWGQGEKRWPNERKYRGEWVRDMMWGDGEMTWPSGGTFRGQFRKGIFHGKGTRVWPDGDWYAGEFKNGEQEGEGTLESAAEGWVYNGRWMHGLMFGEGRVIWPNGVAYAGEWKDGVREGKGRLTWPDGSYYEGQFRRNCIEGHGHKALPNGSWFEGHFRDGELEGHGTFHWADGTEFEGLWHCSEVVGPGRHRFPDGTSITGVFEDRGATGEATKRWANSCIYTGMLLQNQIHHHGTLKWPDGRCYQGHFLDEAMHGQGTLLWSDKDGHCRYRGRFERNAFHGEGVLEWPSKACYRGQFRNGLYHGEGTFEWADRVNVYRGQWELGEMSGRGVLACGGDSLPPKSDPFVYVGEFCSDHMEGNGHVTFLHGGHHHDEYKGEFSKSRFHGMGTFTWSSGHSVSGLFQQNHCNTVGRKVYPGGLEYYGELRMDLEHGKGVLIQGNRRLIGLWQEGKFVEELFETVVPSLELNAREGEEWQKIFGGRRPSMQVGPKSGKGTICPWLPERDESGEVIEGEALVLFLNGDKYMGHVRGGRKHGNGMFVYADLTAYKGEWSEDILGNTRHPMSEKESPEQVLHFHKLNEDVQNSADSLKLAVKAPGHEPHVGTAAVSSAS